LALSTVHTYLGPSAAEAAYTAAEVSLAPTGTAPFKMRVVRVELQDLWLHQVDESGPRIKHAVQTPVRAVIKFLTLPGQELVSQGVALPYQAVLRHGRGHSYYDRTSDAIQWASLSLPVEQLSNAGIAVAGCNLAPLCDSSVFVPRVDAIMKLRQLHRAIVSLAENAPGVLAAPEVVRALEQSLVEALIGCLGDSDLREASWAQQCHEAIMRRFHNLLSDNPGRPIYVPEICAAIRVPERTLRLCCNEHVGMAPGRYLLLRRMHQAQRALSSATAADATVTEIATQFGFWHFGRFSGNYQLIFGERPSATLRRSLH